jgi:hypothetical protein
MWIRKMKYDVSTKAKLPKPGIKPEMLVQHTDGSIGIVTRLSQKHVHVTWLVNTLPDDDEELYDKKGQMVEGKHHFSSFHPRADLKPVPVGTTVTLTQTAD